MGRDGALCRCKTAFTSPGGTTASGTKWQQNNTTEFLHEPCFSWYVIQDRQIIYNSIILICQLQQISNSYFNLQQNTEQLKTLNAFFWVIRRRLKFICWSFGTLCLFHLQRQRTDRLCSETLALKLQMLGNYPEESIQDSEHGKSLKSRKLKIPP
jgi:hypothetical protein